MKSHELLACPWPLPNSPVTPLSTVLPSNVPPGTPQALIFPSLAGDVSLVATQLLEATQDLDFGAVGWKCKAHIPRDVY